MPDDGLRIEVCGSLAVRAGDEDRTAAMPGRQGRALLLYLLLNRHRSVPRDELIDALWAGDPPPAPDPALRALLSKLRSAVRPAVLDGTAQLRLVLPDGASVDVDEMSAALTTAEDCVRRSDHDAALRAARDAIAVAERGPGIDFDRPWAGDLRRSLEEACTRGREILAESALARGEFGLALRAARTLVDEDPYGEHGHALLLRAHEADGTIAAGLRAYEMLRERLRDDMGVGPTRELAALHSRLLRAAAEDDAPPLPAPLAGPSPTPLVGREPVIGRLRAALERVHAGERAVVLLSGVAGIGKTRLLCELGLAAVADDGTVLYGRCAEQPLAPYEVLAEALRPVVAHAPPDARDRWSELGRPQIGRVFPSIGAGTGVAATATPEDRLRLFEAFAEILAHAAAARPVVLALDDLHWADQPTLLALTHLVRRGDPARLLVVGAHRPTGRPPLPDALEELHRFDGVTRIALDGLDREAVRLLAQALHPAAGDDVAGDVHSRTDGNPFLAAQLLRHLAEGGGTTVPEGVREVVSARIARLGADARAIVELAAVMGEDVDASSLTAAAAAEPEAIGAALETAAEAQLLRRTAAGHRFAHALVRDAVEAAINPVRRTGLHARAAAALEAIGGADARVAHHHLQAAPGVSDDALRATVAAMERARRSLAWEQAVQIGRAALDRLADPGDPRAGELLLRIGRSHAAAGDVAAAEEAYAAAADVARLNGDRRAFASAALGFADSLGDWVVPPPQVRARSRREPLLREALAGLPAGRSAGLRSRVLARLALELAYTGRDAERRVLGEEAVAEARRSRDPAALAAALNARHSTMFEPGNQRDRLEVVEELVDRAQAAGDELLAFRGVFWRSLDLMQVGDLTAAAGAAARLAESAARLRQPLCTWIALRAEAGVALVRGEDSLGLAVAERARDEGLRLGHPNARMVWAAQTLWTRYHRDGDFDEETVRAQVDAFGDPIPSWRFHLARMLCEQGRLDEARDELEHCPRDYVEGPSRDVNWLHCVCMLAESAHRLGDAELAASTASLLTPYADVFANVGHTSVTIGVAGGYLGLALLGGGREDDAVAALERAVQREDAAGARPWAERSRLALAEALMVRGQRARATAVAREAESSAAAAGRTWAAARAAAAAASG